MRRFFQIFFNVLLVLTFCFNANQSSAKGKWIVNGQFLEQEVQLPKILLLKFSKTGEYFYTFSSDSILRKWNTETGEILSEKIIRIFQDRKADPVDISSDGNYLLIDISFKNQSYDDSIKVMKYYVPADSVCFELRPPFKSLLVPIGSNKPPVYVFGWGCNAKYSNDESQIYTSVYLSLEYSMLSETGLLNQWDAANGELSNTYNSGNVQDLIISDDDYFIAWNSSISYYWYLHIKEKRCTYLNNISIDTVNPDICHNFTHDNKKLISVKNPSKYKLKIYNISNIKNAVEFNLMIDNKIETLLVSRNDKLAIIADEHNINFVSLSSGEIIDVLALPDSSERRIFRLHPQKNYILYGTSEGLLKLIKPLILTDIYNDESNIYSTNDDLVLSPNPTSDYIEISGSKVILSEAKDPVIRIYDILGIEQFTLTPALSLNGEGVRIDISGLSPGVYFIKIGHVVKKFVKL